MMKNEDANEDKDKYVMLKTNSDDNKGCRKRKQEEIQAVLEKRGSSEKDRNQDDIEDNEIHRSR